jgi:hypothetical protein
LGWTKTKQDDTASSAEDESSQLYNLANSILEECKEAAPISDLNTVVDLLRDTLKQYSAPHPFRLNLLADLARALGTRFSLTNQFQDLDQAVLLRAEIIDVVMKEAEETQFNVCGQCSVLILKFESAIVTAR